MIFISSEFVLEAVPAAKSRVFARTRRMPWSALPESDLRPDVCVSSERKEERSELAELYRLAEHSQSRSERFVIQSCSRETQLWGCVWVKALPRCVVTEYRQEFSSCS